MVIKHIEKYSATWADLHEHAFELVEVRTSDIVLE